MSNRDDILSKEEAEEILRFHLGSSVLIAGNVGSLNKYRSNPLDIKAIKQAGGISVEDLQRYLGVKKLRGRYDMDTHLGQLSKYAWLKVEHPTGAGFAPIFDGISKVQKKIPVEQERLESISRRLAYLCYLEKEIEYMNKKYDYEEIPIIFEFYTNKVEVFTTLLVNLLMIIAELWCDRHSSRITPGPKPWRFDELFDCYSPLEYSGHQIFKSINTMLEISAAISIRHIY